MLYINVFCLENTLKQNDRFTHITMGLWSAVVKGPACQITDHSHVDHLSQTVGTEHHSYTHISSKAPYHTCTFAGHIL